MWDRMEDLHFKAFVLRERGVLGASANGYASIYLWRSTDGFRDFVASPRFEVVTNSFGRPAIDVRIVLDARRGPADEARFAVVEDNDIPSDGDLAKVAAAEIEANRSFAVRTEVVATLVALDAARWRLKRVSLLSEPPHARQGVEIHQILHLARPLLDTLARA